MLTNITLYSLAVSTALIAILIALPFLLIYWIWRFLRGIYLSYCFRAKWGREDKFILFIYSESRIWHDYIKENTFSRLKHNAVTLNWSRRAEWKKHPTLESKVFQHWRGQREYNPMAIIFLSYGRVKRIRFYKAFKKKGELLKRQEELLFKLLNERKKTDNHPMRRVGGIRHLPFGDVGVKCKL
jgi:hypothetical protein